jgi:hypothetical protein
MKPETMTEAETSRDAQAQPRCAPAAGSARPSTIWHDGSWNRDELIRMAQGERLDRNGKRYAMCSGCRTIIRLDKPILSSLHVCE